MNFKKCEGRYEALEKGEEGKRGIKIQSQRKRINSLFNQSRTIIIQKPYMNIINTELPKTEEHLAPKSLSNMWQTGERKKKFSQTF